MPIGAVEAVVFLIVTNTSSVGDFIYGWGAQLERSPIGNPTSYVLTTSTVPVVPRGMLTFAIAPAATATITASFSHYYRCHFLDDEFNDLSEFLYQLWELKALKFRSLLL